MTEARTEKRGRRYHHGDLRRALVDAAESLLGERGPEGFTLRECARRAGVSHAAPAHHFGDVAGLLAEVAADGFDRLEAITRTARDTTPGGPGERLFAMMQAYVEIAVGHPAVFRLMFASDRISRESDRLEESGAAAYMVLVEAVGDLAEDLGRSRPGPFAPDVLLVWSLVHGFASLLVEKRLEHGTAVLYGGDWRARRDELFRLFLKAIARGG